MKKIVILSIHMSYDYRITKHIKSLLDLGYFVYYYNISPEEKPQLNISHKNMEYSHFYIKKLITFKTIKIYFMLRGLLSKNQCDYYFLQDIVLISLFINMKSIDKHKIVIDFHEILDRESKVNRALFKIYCNQLNENIILALEQNVFDSVNKNIYLFKNVPLLEDFKNSMAERQVGKYCIIYAGMITEENRQMLKTLNVFDILLTTGCFKAVLIGRIANRVFKNEIEEKISHLKDTYGDDFSYFGEKPHGFVVEKIMESDFSINLLNYDDNIALSPNKNYEYLLGVTVLITDHKNLTVPLAEDTYVYVDKRLSAAEIADKIKELAENNAIDSISRKGMEFIIERQLLWERYYEDYNKIFE